MMGFLEFLCRVLMTFTAVLWRYDCGNDKPFVFIGISVFFICLMTFNTSNAFFSMPAVFPVIHLPLSHIFFYVAVYTFFIGRGYIRPYLLFTCLHLHIAHYCEGYKEDEA